MTQTHTCVCEREGDREIEGGMEGRGGDTDADTDIPYKYSYRYSAMKRIDKTFVKAVH